MLEYRALGGLSVVDGGDELTLGGARQRRLVAMLLVHRNCVVSVDQLAEVVFAGEPTEAAATTLRSYVARLRRVVQHDGGASRVVTQAPGYKLEVPDEAFDVARFEAALAHGRSALSRGDAAGAALAFREALALWRGQPYAEFADEDWARGEASRLTELRLVADEELADAELSAGRAAEATSLLEGLVAEHPLRESLRSRMMLALYLSGRQVEALRSYQAYRALLAEEMGLEPSPELSQLEGRILAHDESLLAAPAGAAELRGFRLGERLGTGRDGTVYAAQLPGVERDLAIRIVPEELANDAHFVRTFDADARRVASLHHEAIVPVHDWWREPGAAYVVMRRMRGGTLRDQLHRGRLSPATAVALTGRVGAALVAAAETGMVHDRVVPESVLFDESGAAYLADFPLGTAAGRGSAGGNDMTDLVALAAEAVAGFRPQTWREEGLPAGLADACSRAGALPAEASPEDLAEVVAALVAAVAGQSAGPTVGPTIANPYKGLRAFDEPDAADFFGRDRLVDDILQRLAARRLVLVVGGSGSGKSSVVRAGLLPRVRQDGVPGSASWFVATMVPGKAPFDELAEALRQVAVADVEELPTELAAGESGLHEVLDRLVPPEGELLLVVDQLEELFTLAPEGDQRAFLNGVVHATSAPGSRLRVVATLRADFYDRPLRFAPFAAAVGEATVPVGAMSAEELEAAIVGPAARVGAEVEPALVAELVGAVVHEPAALPSLQFTLTELTERSVGGRLALSTYRELGGVEGAIAQRAEDLYRTLAPDVRRGVRRMFEQLVVLGPAGEPTRRRALLTDLEVITGATDASGDTDPTGGRNLTGGEQLGDAPRVDDVVETWAQARLLTRDRDPDSRVPTVEVAHEALLREWPRLRDWIEEDREEIATLGHLREAAAGWESLGRDPGALYRGVRLEAALAVVGGDGAGGEGVPGVARQRSLPAVERAFLDASGAERDRERQAEAERAEQAIRTNRRLRAQLVALGVALVLALVVGAIAVTQRNRAESQGRLAEARELAAAANANLDVDPERSVLLALAAVERSSGGNSGGGEDGDALPEAEEALHRAVTSSRIERRFPGMGVLDWSPDGETFTAVRFAEDESHVVDVRDAQTGEAIHTLEGHEAYVTDAAYSADGSRLATTALDGTLRVWDAAGGEALHTVEGTVDDDALWGPSFSADGRLVAAPWLREGVVRLVDVASGRTVREIRSVPAPDGTSFSPDGERLAVASATAPMAKVVSVGTGEDLHTLEGHIHAVADIAWSPDGRSIATSSSDGSARIWDAATGTQRFALLGHEAYINNVDWSPGSGHLATASDDGTAKVWTFVEGGPRLLFTLSAQETQAGVMAVAFSADGSRLMTADVHTAATRVWDVSVGGDAEVANLPGVAFHYGAGAYTPDGQHLVAASVGNAVTVWDVGSGQVVRTLGGRPGPTVDGVLEPVLPTELEVGAVTVAPDGRSVAALTYADGAYYRGQGNDLVRAWDLRSGDEVLALRPGGEILGAAWSPDGQHLALALSQPGRPDRILVVDRRGEEVAELESEPPAGVGDIAFSPDGRRLVAPRHQIEESDGETRGVDVWDWRRSEVVETIDTPRGESVVDPTGRYVAVTPEDEGDSAGNGDGTGSGDTDSGDGADDADTELWGLAAGRRVASLPGGTGNVAVSADGTTAVTGGNDGVLRVWDVEHGTERVALRGHLGAVADVTITPGGTQAASVGADGIVRVWALRLDDLVAIAEDGLTRTLTDSECRRYLHVDRCDAP